MAALAAELGIGPEDTPPAAVADLVSRFGPASYAAARHVAFDPTCLRWLALIYRFWAEQLLHYADAEDLAALDLVTEAERLLRDR